MNVLVIGGTRYFGIHLVNSLLDRRYNVTIATRGNAKDPFGNSVERLIIERTNLDSLQNAFRKRSFDIVYDNLVYCSNEVKFLLDSINCGKYIMTSSSAVYLNKHLYIKEKEFDPCSYSLKWCDRQDYSYDEIKRQAECALFQRFLQFSGIAVRFPFVMGEDDYTKRLYLYVENIVKGNPIHIDNLNNKFGLIKSNEAGDFLAWLSGCNFTGSINGNSEGAISLGEIIDYVEKKVGKKAVISSEGAEVPFNGQETCSLDNELANNLGYRFSNLTDWIYELLDKYIDKVQ